MIGPGSRNSGEDVVEETFGLLCGKRDLVEKLLRELEDEIALH